MRDGDVDRPPDRPSATAEARDDSVLGAQRERERVRASSNGKRGKWKNKKCKINSPDRIKLHLIVIFLRNFYLEIFL